MNLFIQTLITQASIAVLKGVLDSHTDARTRAEKKYAKLHDKHTKELEKAANEYNKAIESSVLGEVEIKNILTKQLSNITVIKAGQ